MFIVTSLPCHGYTVYIFPGSREDTLEKEMATHSGTLAWKIPWTEEPGRLQSMGLLLGRSFPTQGSNPGLPFAGGFFHLSHQGSPRILEWVAYPFCRGSSRPRNWTPVSWIAGGFFTSWATREDLLVLYCSSNHLRLEYSKFPGI